MDKPTSGACVGQTWAQWEAMFVVSQAEGQLPPGDVTESMSTLLALGHITECSEHPGYYISNRWQQLAEKRRKKE